MGDKIKTQTYSSVMTTAISGHLHRGCKRTPVTANITDIEFLQYYDPQDFENSLPFPSSKCMAPYQKRARAKRAKQLVKDLKKAQAKQIIRVVDGEKKKCSVLHGMVVCRSFDQGE